jgi:hypothetical protein
LIVQLVKTGHRADFHAVGEFASLAFARNNMWHNVSSDEGFTRGNRLIAGVAGTAAG